MYLQLFLWFKVQPKKTPEPSIMEMYIFLTCLADKNKPLIFDSFSENMLDFSSFISNNKEKQDKIGWETKYIYLIIGADFLKCKKNLCRLRPGCFSLNKFADIWVQMCAWKKPNVNTQTYRKSHRYSCNEKRGNLFRSY